jgi:hypothetical protein
MFTTKAPKIVGRSKSNYNYQIVYIPKPSSNEDNFQVEDKHTAGIDSI